MKKHPFKKTHLFLLISKWIIGILIGITIFLVLFGSLSHYFYLKALGQVGLVKPVFHQSLKNAFVSAIPLIIKYWTFFYQRRILIILALLISFPFVRHFVRRKISHRVQKRPILKKLYHWVPWIRIIILTWLIVHFMLYDVAKKVGKSLAQESMVRWNQYIERSDIPHE